MRVLLLRIAPTWNCCTQPRAWSKSARRWSSAERKARASPASSVRPARSRAKSACASMSVTGSASMRSRPWSEARQPSSWKKPWRLSSASSSESQVPIETPDAASSFSTHAVQAPRSSTMTALSGRQVGYTCVAGALRLARRACGSSESMGSSVLQTTATFHCASRPSAEKLSCFSVSLARANSSRAFGASSGSSMPNGRLSSIGVQW